ncbi:cysteine-rich repeat secretory protein 11-like [Cynara cardunculus var. scolymus]|uniref:cysteine-rich repeat secretory protein 11-like n=1 Tax=Cynara cardunculus var. scolymus TaxID=59895 RepID=UPI000D628625|nr:cysteine-rich repeat secretory protein 11-like [Cynara cardunculus var. scolymus]
MASPANHFILILLLHTLRRSLPLSAAAPSGLINLIYKGCANQNFQNSDASENLKSLYTTLLSQSSTTNFYKTISDENDQSTTTIAGLYQCRGDLSNSDCNTCVKKLPETIAKVCNRATIAARVQLGGCYLRYEVLGFPQVPATELLYKQCSSRRASGSGFDERLASALSLIPKGVANGKGYYAGGYQSVYVLGQCEGDLGGGECVNCVKSAVGIGKSECQTSISGHIYLQQCYISYTYYPDGVPGADGGSVGGVGGVETAATETGGGGGGGGKNNTEKTVAIVFGGLAGLGLVVAFLLVLKSAFRKKKEHYYGGY